MVIPDSSGSNAHAHARCGAEGEISGGVIAFREETHPVSAVRSAVAPTAIRLRRDGASPAGGCSRAAAFRPHLARFGDAVAPAFEPGLGGLPGPPAFLLAGLGPCFALELAPPAPLAKELAPP